LALVAEAVRLGASMTQIARRYGISTGLLYTWHRLVQQGELSLAPVPANSPGFVPVEIVPEIPRRERRGRTPHHKPFGATANPNHQRPDAT
jgi:transposase-like protein